MKKIKWIHWCWVGLTLLFLFFRLQNLQGVFTKDGVILNDTDPYYRLHRMDVMLNEHRFYNLHDDHLNYPDGIDVSWPLGLDLLVSLPLKLYHSTSHAEIESFAAIIIPFLSLPLLWFSGWIGNFLGGPLFGLLLGSLITCSSTLIYQTGLGRLDHHFLEAMFPILLLMFVIKYLQTRERFCWIGTVLLLSFAPSFAPQGWVIGAFMATGLIWKQDWKNAHAISKIFCWSFFLSLIPLSFTDHFLRGFIHWGSFSWWTPFVYLLGACTFECIHLSTQSLTEQSRKYKITLGTLLILVTTFLIVKNQLGFFTNNIAEAVRSVTVKTGTMATTLEARTPFQLSFYTWTHTDMCIIFVASICMLFLIYKRAHTFIVGYALLPLLLSLFQIRFATMALPVLFVVTLLFFRDWVEKLKISSRNQKWAFLTITILLIIPFRPVMGLTEVENSHYYFRPIRAFSLFLNQDLKNRNAEKKDQAIIAHWDYGHWLLYYTGLPVVADPFQGPSAYEVLELFTSIGTDQLEPFLKRHPSKYLVIESGAQRSMRWLETVHKDTSLYFEKIKESKDNEFYRTTPAFDDLFMFRFFFELGRGMDNNHPKNWRLIYISPYSPPMDDDISALKVFEHVQGVTIQAKSTKPYKYLYLQAQVGERNEATVFQQVATGGRSFEWTVPYGIYDRGGVKFDGTYYIRDEHGKVLKKIAGISEDQVLQGDRLEVRF